MRIVLQNTVDGRYLDLSDEWISNLESARDFVSSLDALFFCFAQHLNHVQIVVVFRNPQTNFTLPVVDAF